jgi:hypothetical protein
MTGGRKKGLVFSASFLRISKNDPRNNTKFVREVSCDFVDGAFWLRQGPRVKSVKLDLRART